MMPMVTILEPNTARKTIMISIMGMDCRICCLTDAQRWKRLVGPMGHLFEYQLKGADLILVNKKDLVDEATLAEVMESVRGYNDTALIAATCANEAIPEGLFKAVLEKEG